MEDQDSVESEDSRVFGEEKKNFWHVKRDYFNFFLLLGKSDWLIGKIFMVMERMSGGVFLVLLFVASILFTVPVMYMEDFLGLYTRKSSGMLYTAAPFFLGYTTFLFAMNLLVIPLNSVLGSVFILETISLAINGSVDSICFHDDPLCYNYRIYGRINDSCARNFSVIHCSLSDRTIMFPKQYNNYVLYKKLDSLDISYKLIGGVSVVWIIALLVIHTKLTFFGQVVSGVFYLHLSSTVVVFLLSLTAKGSISGIQNLITFSPKEIVMSDLAIVILISFRLYALVVPMGHMTYSSKLIHSELYTFTIFFSNYILITFYLFTLSSIDGIISYQMGTPAGTARIVGHMSSIILVPEFLRFMDCPNFFIIYFYMCESCVEVMKCAASMRMVFFNFYHVFPNISKFRIYFNVVTSLVIVFFLLTLTNHFAFKVIIPLLLNTDLSLASNLILIAETIMVFYVYGIPRLSDDILYTFGQSPNPLYRMGWLIAPITQLIIFATISSSSSLSINNDVEMPSNSNIVSGVTVFIWGLFGVFFICSSVAYSWYNFSKYSTCENNFKPQFHWGPMIRSKRQQRKMFSPHTHIRSQPVKSKKLLAEVKEVYIKTGRQEDVVKHVKEVDDLARALATGDETDSLIILVAKKGAEKGRIFGDTEYFSNLDCMSTVMLTATCRKTGFKQ